MRIHRRDFVKGAAAAAAALPLRGIAAANDRINLAVIGCRNQGIGDGVRMVESGQFNMVTLCDCDDVWIDHGLKKLSDKQVKKPQREKDFRRVLEDPEIDAVVVGTPDHWHAQMTVMALAAGKHVYLEKPASYNIEDGKAMLAAQKRNPKPVVLVGTQQRSGKHFQEAKAFIDGGGLGKIAFARAMRVGMRDIVPVVPDGDPPSSLDYDMWLGPAPHVPYNENRVHYNWRFMRPYGTGETGNWGAHWIDVASWFLNLDYPKSAAGLGGVFVTHDAKEWPDTETVIFEYPELTLLWELRIWSRFGPGGGMGGGVEISGEKGAITINRGGWTFYPNEKDADDVEHPETELSMAHAVNFADAIRGHAKPSASLEDGCKSAAICHLGNIASILNRRIEFDPVNQTIIGDLEATAMAGREYRKPWDLSEYV